jgi:hypothetical protein
MSLIVELRETIERFRKTIQQLDQDIVHLAEVIDNHFDINHAPMPKISLPKIEKDMLK